MEAKKDVLKDEKYLNEVRYGLVMPPLSDQSNWSIEEEACNLEDSFVSNQYHHEKDELANYQQQKQKEQELIEREKKRLMSISTS